MSKVVLITGCSTGIGRHLALRLTQSGHNVVATARNVNAMKDLDVAFKLPLDVTDPASIQNAVDSVMHHFGRIDVLVNNAGYAQIGPLEELSDNQIQKMFNVNVFGAIRMTRAVVPHMRKQKSGRIINISSIAGKMVTPVNGSYAASKFALEALSDALRWELNPFNIQVILIEPGAIKTNFDQTVHTYGDEILSNQSSPYIPLYRKYQQVSDGMRGQEPGPEAVSKVIQLAMESSRPKARYLAGVGVSIKLAISLRDWTWDSIVRQLFKLAPQE